MKTKTLFGIVLGFISVTSSAAPLISTSFAYHELIKQKNIVRTAEQCTLIAQNSAKIAKKISPQRTQAVESLDYENALIKCEYPTQMYQQANCINASNTCTVIQLKPISAQDAFNATRQKPSVKKTITNNIY